jgi:hypothetical protein
VTIAIGVLIVLLAFAFVLLPLFRRTAEPMPQEIDPVITRAGLYQQILDAELDTRLGKLDETDFHELRQHLLRDAALLIVRAEGRSEIDLDAARRVEEEIAAARAAMRRQASATGVNA